MNILEFTLGSQMFCIDASDVLQVIMYKEPLKIPTTSTSVEGIIRVRDQTVLLINLHTLLGIEQKIPDKDTVIVTCDLDNELIALRVTSSGPLRSIEDELCKDMPALLTNNPYAKKVIKFPSYLSTMLDLQKITSMWRKEYAILCNETQN